MYIYAYSGPSEGWHSHTYSEQTVMVTSTLEDMGMPTSFLDEKAITCVYIYIYISTYIHM